MKRLLALALLLIASPAWGASNVLNWVDNSGNESGFVIERKAELCAGSGTFTQFATVGQNVTTFTDTLVTEGTAYCYRVAANNSAGTSAFSNTAGRTVPFSVPVAPSGLTVTPGP